MGTGIVWRHHTNVVDGVAWADTLLLLGKRDEKCKVRGIDDIAGRGGYGDGAKTTAVESTLLQAVGWRGKGEDRNGVAIVC